jgi:hypothetical protein
MSSKLYIETLQNNSGGSPTFPNKINYVDFPPGSIIQVAYAESNVSGTGTTPIPADDTIPQITEGNLILTCNITPRFANSKLLVMARLNAMENSNLSSTNTTCALFLNNISDSFVAEIQSNEMQSPPMGDTNIQGGIFTLVRQIDAVGTNTHTITMRAGLGGAGSGTTFRWNGGQGNRYLGGSQYTSILIQEIRQ